jgi:hypothetical protein
MSNLPLPDRAGRGDVERQVNELARDMRLNGGKDAHEFQRLAHKLDKARKKFHDIYGVKESTHTAPMHEHDQR